MTALRVEPETQLSLPILYLVPEPFDAECWIADCARPRVDGVLCEKHAEQRVKP
jgi:hypothetical protein